MKIAIDVTPLKSAHQYRGIGFYTKNLIWALKKYKPDNQYIFFTRGKNLPKNADLVHYPCFDLFNWTLPLFKKLPTVVTIHDLIPLLFPDKFPRGIKGEIKWQLERFSLKSVCAIIADSDNSKRDIIEFTSFPQERIHVIPLAPGREFKKLEIGNWKLEIKQKYQLPDIFVLYVGDVNWNKNIAGLIKAFANIKNTAQKDAIFSKSLVSSQARKLKIEELKLVLVGKAFTDQALRETREINLLIDKLKIANSVLQLGFVPTDDLVAIYNLATVYCQPSFYEGFGLPCLEAMACGTPVVAADIPVVREVCGEAAAYVDPYDVDKIAEGIDKVLRYNIAEYQSRMKAGLRWVKKFSWRKAAQETVKVYEKVAG